MSRAKETLLFLAKFNSWRRGDEAIEMPDPFEIGAVIDDAVNLLRRYDELERENAALRGLLRDIRNNKWDAFELALQIDEAIDAAKKEAQP